MNLAVRKKVNFKAYYPPYLRFHLPLFRLIPGLGGCGVFSTRSIYHDIDAKWADSYGPPTIWPTLIPSKVNIFIWRAQRFFLLCYLHLAMRGVPLESVACPVCSAHFEDVDHAIFRCLVATPVWDAVASWCGVSNLFLWEVSDLFSLKH